MPSLSANKTEWDKTYAWDRDGDEWSDLWGGSTLMNRAGIKTAVFQNDRFLNEAEAIKRIAALATADPVKQS